ncbi:hypothetical protein LTR56_012182 [Elasticomyces elasticus]|nr:hypothetical protein LTR56_012182 [Elasticomyces elasticus]KAK3663615.1 hypothetical protein LTR22_005555 [Elasticomyces elasticus]KAK4921735.1 hypothetical protein LTR49_010841 [Elasticomyces elasticus]KAK4957481.1 hypothetical protein LTR10_005446 [Elasticomyces elasticus]KAK4976183.1 hypothetical protein LTR42_003810 [Elasticomyces elasticus]
MSFEPKQKVELDAPKDDVISIDYLSKCDGSHQDYPTYVAIKVCRAQVYGTRQAYFDQQGTVFDVSGNKAYGPEGSYKVFAGKDASRALAQSSLKEEECRPDWEDLSDDHKKVLNDWYTFFSKRYNIKGKVEGATNM